MPGKPRDQKQRRIVARLAAQCHVSIGEMTTLYAAERDKLATGAHITKFLDIFATRHVLEAFQLQALAVPISAPVKNERAGE